MAASQDPYSPPESRPTALKPQDLKVPNAKGLALTGLTLMSLPLLTSLMMIVSFCLPIHRSSLIIAICGDLNAYDLMVKMFYYTIIFSIPGLVGMGILMVVFSRRYNEQRWFLTSAKVMSVLWMILLFPAGLIPAGIMLNAVRVVKRDRRTLDAIEIRRQHRS